MANLTSELGRRELTLVERIQNISWGLMLLIVVAACFGIVVLYSAADGSMQPWAATQSIRFAIALVPLIVAALWLLVRPAAAYDLPKKGWGPHLLNPESIRKIRALGAHGSPGAET